VIDRRHTGSAPLGALEYNHDKDRWKTVGRKCFFLLTTVNHISAHQETVFLPDICVMLKILSSEYQPYACGKIFRTP